MRELIQSKRGLPHNDTSPPHVPFDASMTDLLLVLPAFPTKEYTHLIPSLEKNLVTTTDLLTLDVVEIARRAQLPLPDLKRLCDAVLNELQSSLGVEKIVGAEYAFKETLPKLRKAGTQILESWDTISTLDESTDAALGGGIPTGYITEITGESGAGKTQFLLGLLLATQLPTPHGVSKAALYISTESAIPTTRLSQMLTTHPLLLSAHRKPTLDRIISIVTPDLESQDHILRYQVPVAIRRHKIGLVVLDSVAANYRAEFERPGANRNGAHMAKRSAELVKLGQLLRDLARSENVAVVVANQVADRFTGSGSLRVNYDDAQQTQSSPLALRGVLGTSPHPPSSIIASQPSHLSNRFDRTETLTLDHQQRWFTGWGDDPSLTDPKTPSLGLVWTTQIACRIALIKVPVYENVGGEMNKDGERSERERVLKEWKRYVKVVFAPWTGPTGAGIEGAVEFKITGAGIKAVSRDTSAKVVEDD